MKKCSYCKLEKTEREFGKDSHSKTGLTSRCLICLSQYRKQKKITPLKEGEKKCSHCQKIKHIELFGKNSQRFDGRQVYCKDCYNKKCKEYRKKNPTVWEKQKEKNFQKWRENIGVSLEEMPRRRKPGEGYISKSGYHSYFKKGHPCADKNGRVQASHLVIYEKTGRILKNGETVHHINGDTLDNRFENLEIWIKRQPPGQRLDDKIKWCIDFLEEYGYEVNKI